jgi:hypothetical protein
MERKLSDVEAYISKQIHELDRAVGAENRY